MTETMTGLADELVETETERHGAFEELKASVGEGRNATFYQVVVHLDHSEREELAELYRMMKFSVFGIQTTTYCMDEHVRTINDTMHDILGEMYPHRKGKMYSRHGAELERGTNPLLVDREL